MGAQLRAATSLRGRPPGHALLAVPALALVAAAAAAAAVAAGRGCFRPRGSTTGGASEPGGGSPGNLSRHAAFPRVDALGGQQALRSAALVFASTLSHQMRDATRRGLWLWPLSAGKAGKSLFTPPIPYPLYIAALAGLAPGVASALRWHSRKYPTRQQRMPGPAERRRGGLCV